jgi:hypothetical protein
LRPSGRESDPQEIIVTIKDLLGELGEKLELPLAVVGKRAAILERRAEQLELQRESRSIESNPTLLVTVRVKYETWRGGSGAK